MDKRALASTTCARAFFALSAALATAFLAVSTARLSAALPGLAALVLASAAFLRAAATFFASASTFAGSLSRLVCALSTAGSTDRAVLRLAVARLAAAVRGAVFITRLDRKRTR